MKKFITVLLCMIMVLSLFSCELNTQNENTDKTDSTQAPDADKAVEMYEAAVRGEIYVLDERQGDTKLESLRLLNSGTRLDESKLLTKAILDVDRDGVSEYIIKSPEYECIILRCYNERVYVYRLEIRDFYKFNTDGSFYWCNSYASDVVECGLNKIVFEGEALKIQPLYSVKNSPNAATKYEYFVEGEVVGESEYYTYISDKTNKEPMKFSQFELSCPYPITAEQAWNLANAYWDNQDGQTDGAAGTIFTYKVVLIDTPSSESDCYRVALCEESYSNVREGGECMPPYNVQVVDELSVNALTGEITAS